MCLATSSYIDMDDTCMSIFRKVIANVIFHSKKSTISKGDKIEKKLLNKAIDIRKYSWNIQYKALCESTSEFFDLFDTLQKNTKLRSNR